MIYIASPYNHSDSAIRQWRYERNVALLARMLHDGMVAFSPIVHHHPIALLADLGRGWSYWQRVDVSFLRLATKLIVFQLPGWDESIGVKAEIEIATSLYIPVEYLRFRSADEYEIYGK